MIDKYGYDFVYKSGARIYTTLDLDMQIAANQALRDPTEPVGEGLQAETDLAGYDSTAKRDSTIGPPKYLQGALVAMDVKTGYVRALIVRA